MKTYSQLLEEVGVERLDEAKDVIAVLQKAEKDIEYLGQEVLKKMPKKIRIEDFVEHIQPAIKKIKKGVLSDDEVRKILFVTSNHIKQLARMAGQPSHRFLKGMDI